jgi:hypothetical protein
MQNIHDILQKREPLVDELKQYLTTSHNMKVLRHPLVYGVPYSKEMNALYNEQLKHKKTRIKEARAAKNWILYIMLHERPHRINALMEIYTEIENNQQYWELVRDVLMDSENLWQHKSHIRLLLSMKEGRHHLMTYEEQDFLSKLDDNITIYRGCTPRNRGGTSWTLDKEKAEWFAKRFSTEKPTLLIGECKKKDVIAYFEGRNEKEIIIFPEKVKVKETRLL